MYTRTHTRARFITICCQPKTKLSIFSFLRYHLVYPRDFLGEPLPLFLLRYKALAFSLFIDSRLFPVCFVSFSIGRRWMIGMLSFSKSATDILSSFLECGGLSFVVLRLGGLTSARFEIVGKKSHYRFTLEREYRENS